MPVSKAWSTEKHGHRRRDQTLQARGQQSAADFLFAEHFDHQAKVLTITASDFDSAAFADMILRHPEVVAFEDETGPFATPAWSVVAVIAGTKFSARVVRQRLYAKPGATVRLTPI